MGLKSRILFLANVHPEIPDGRTTGATSGRPLRCGAGDVILADEIIPLASILKRI